MAQLKDRDLRRLRAMMMVKDRVMGMEIAEIAAKYSVHPDTVHRALQFARKEDLIRDHEAKVLEDLVPKAMQAVMIALEDGDAQVALEILKGTNVLKKQQQNNAPARVESRDGEEDIYAIITADYPVLNGEIIGGSHQKALTARAESADEEVDISQPERSHTPENMAEKDGTTYNQVELSPLQRIAGFANDCKIE